MAGNQWQLEEFPASRDLLLLVTYKCCVTSSLIIHIHTYTHTYTHTNTHVYEGPHIVCCVLYSPPLIFFLKILFMSTLITSFLPFFSSLLFLLEFMTSSSIATKSAVFSLIQSRHLSSLFSPSENVAHAILHSGRPFLVLIIICIHHSTELRVKGLSLDMPFLITQRFKL